ncbi:hypothetical protein [Lyngbya aestuarii]|uniref:hypothetical protein n=1 Tax=Lyngbya aestuarii TaxID=118322 RepID=UPI00403DC62A
METTEFKTIPVTLLTNGSATVTGNFTSVASAYVLPSFEEALELPSGGIPRSFNFEKDFEVELGIKGKDPFPSEIQLGPDVLTSVNGFNQDSSIAKVLDKFGVDDSELIESLDKLGIKDIGDAGELANDLFDVSLNGTGTFQSDINGDGFIDPVTEFTTFSVETFQNEDFDDGYLLITGYDPLIAENILTSDSQLSFNGFYNVDLNTNELIDLLGDLEAAGIADPGTSAETSSLVRTGRNFGVVDAEGDLGLLTGTVNLTDVSITVV